MALTKQDEERLSTEQKAERRHLRKLIERYEAVRPLRRCPDRDSAERLLEVALARYGPFEHQGWVWRWSEIQESLMRERACRHTHTVDYNEESSNVPQSSRRHCGRIAGHGQAFGGWSIKGRTM